MIQTVKQRAALKAQREPYFVAMGKGRHIGYRRTADGGTWIARAYDPATQKRVYSALGDLANVPASEQFGAAQQAAAKWFAHLDGGGSKDAINVREACALYVAKLEKRGTPTGDRKAKKTAQFFARHLDADPIAVIQLTKLQPRHVEEWRDRFEAAPMYSQKPGQRNTKKTRTLGTLNAGLVMLRAALNLALANGYSTVDVWKQKLLKNKGAHATKKIYLTRANRAALLAAMDREALPFFTALTWLPIRPGALAAALVADFDSRTRKLYIRQDKAGAGRTIQLPEEIAKLFKDQSRLKLQTAPIFPRADGTVWTWDFWRYPMSKAVEDAKLPAEVTAYHLRHAGISDLLETGLDIYTIAQTAGTSVEMIEKTYGKVNGARVENALARLVV
jgi:integrase